MSLSIDNYIELKCIKFPNKETYRDFIFQKTYLHASTKIFPQFKGTLKLKVEGWKNTRLNEQRQW